jgi:hypothetical protein
VTAGLNVAAKHQQLPSPKGKLSGVGGMKNGPVARFGDKLLSSVTGIFSPKQKDTKGSPKANKASHGQGQRPIALT